MQVIRLPRLRENMLWDILCLRFARADIYILVSQQAFLPWGFLLLPFPHNITQPSVRWKTIESHYGWTMGGLAKTSKNPAG